MFRGKRFSCSWSATQIHRLSRSSSAPNAKFLQRLMNWNAKTELAASMNYLDPSEVWMLFKLLREGPMPLSSALLCACSRRKNRNQSYTLKVQNNDNMYWECLRNRRASFCCLSFSHRMRAEKIQSECARVGVCVHIFLWVRWSTISPQYVLNVPKYKGLSTACSA